MGRTCVWVERIEVPVNIKTLLNEISKEGKKILGPIEQWKLLIFKPRFLLPLLTSLLLLLLLLLNVASTENFGWFFITSALLLCNTDYTLSLFLFLLLLYIHLCIMVINLWMKKNEHHNFLWVRMSKWAPLIEQIKSNFSKVCWKMRKDTDIIGFCSHFYHH